MCGVNGPPVLYGVTSRSDQLPVAPGESAHRISALNRSISLNPYYLRMPTGEERLLIRLIGHVALRRLCAWLIGVMASVVLVPTLFLRGYKLDHAAFPYLLGGMAISALVCLLSWAVSQTWPTTEPISAEHREFLQAAAQAVRSWLPVMYPAQARVVFPEMNSAGHRASPAVVEASLRAHFPDVGEMMDERELLIDRAIELQGAVRQAIESEAKCRDIHSQMICLHVTNLTVGNIIAPLHQVEQQRIRGFVWADRDDGYIGTVDVQLARVDDVGDLSTFKVSCEQLFQWAQTCDAAQMFHVSLVELDVNRSHMRPRLDEIRAAFKITGRCLYCR